ncbi:MAG: aspartyl aminopeptidase [Planctomycetota bacterium]|jgi:aspartyl aminopeptidase
MTAPDRAVHHKTALDLASFIDASPSAYHACAEAARRLDAAGFKAVLERDSWGAEVPQRGYVLRGGALVAWSLPAADSAPPETGFRLVGAHTDSPNLRVKPRPDTGSAKFRQVGVEVYGGVLLNSWLDRDLGLSGRAYIEESGELVEKLFLVDRPILRVPQLAIHLDRAINETGLKLDKQQHMVPIMSVGDRTEGAFKEFLAEEIGTTADAIKSYDAMVHDLTPSTLFGSDESMLAAPRLDNLCSSYCGIEALLRATEAGSARPMVIALFDHEEVGSASRGGADGPIMGDVIERLVLARGGDRETYLRCLSDSLCISADMAHAVHPNYADLHEPGHHIHLNEGPVIKINANQRYATEAGTEAQFQLACERAGVPVQKWVMKTNMACGSTIGPLTAAQHGMPTVDVGIAQLSMHSAREMCGSMDPEWMVLALTEALKG